MPSFLTKVFGRKKDGNDDSSAPRASQGDLLDGKFEEVSLNISPSATEFPDFKSNGSTRGRGAERTDSRLRTFFRSRSRPASPIRPQRKLDELPQLPLSLFTNISQEDSPFLLTDKVIGERKLTPVEAVGLVKACSQAISSHGPETLGIMTPHWYSASPDVQRRLISLFLHSLTANSPLSNVPSFDSEINDTRSTHDVAAVLRWGLRHLQLQGSSFGHKEDWYQAFFDQERKAEYPPKAYTNTLAPLIPSEHLEFLNEVLELFSSLAAHAETNSTSGSRLSKIFGLWLLNSHRVETKDDWRSFYDRWEVAGRQLEHVFFARIRDEAVANRTPIRLLELVRKYPFYEDQASPTTDLHLLPRSRLTTRLHYALLVRVETELPSERLRPKSKVHPLRLIADALSATSGDNEFAALWTKIVDASKAGGPESPLRKIFSEDTIRFLSLLPEEEGSDDPKSPTYNLLPLSPSSPKAKRLSFSLTEFTDEIKRTASSQSKSTASPLSPLSAGDWSAFSASGFGTSPSLSPLSTTLVSDVERTIPPSRRPSRHGKEASAPRRSVEFSPVPVTKDVPAEEVTPLPSKIGPLQVIQLDEAFIEFWTDALLDPVAANWPAFVLCKVKSTLVPELQLGQVDEGTKPKTVKWLVLEQAFTVKPPVAPETNAEGSGTHERPSSPQSATKKRFSFWSSSRSNSVSSLSSAVKNKKRERAQRVSEMGEVAEEDRFGTAGTAAGRSRKRVRDDVVKLRIPSPKGRKSGDGITLKSIGGMVAGRKSGEVSGEAAASIAATAAAAAAAAIVSGKEDGVYKVVPEAAVEVEAAAPIGNGKPVEDKVDEDGETAAPIEKKGVPELEEPIPVTGGTRAEEIVPVAQEQSIPEEPVAEKEEVAAVLAEEGAGLAAAEEPAPVVEEKAAIEEAAAPTVLEKSIPEEPVVVVEEVIAVPVDEVNPSVVEEKSIAEVPVAHFVEVPVIEEEADTLALTESKPVLEEPAVAIEEVKAEEPVVVVETEAPAEVDILPEPVSEPAPPILEMEEAVESEVPATVEEDLVVISNGEIIKVAPVEEEVKVESASSLDRDIAVEVEEVPAQTETTDEDTAAVQEQAPIVVSESALAADNELSKSPEVTPAGLDVLDGIELSAIPAIQALVAATEEEFGHPKTAESGAESDPAVVSELPVVRDRGAEPSNIPVLDQSGPTATSEEDKPEATEDPMDESHFVAKLITPPPYDIDQETSDTLADPVVAVAEWEAEVPQGDIQIQEVQGVVAAVAAEEDATSAEVVLETLEDRDVTTPAAESTIEETPTVEEYDLAAETIAEGLVEEQHVAEERVSAGEVQLPISTIVSTPGEDVEDGGLDTVETGTHAFQERPTAIEKPPRTPGTVIEESEATDIPKAEHETSDGEESAAPIEGTLAVEAEIDTGEAPIHTETSAHDGNLITETNPEPEVQLLHENPVIEGPITVPGFTVGPGPAGIEVAASALVNEEKAVAEEEFTTQATPAQPEELSVGGEPAPVVDDNLVVEGPAFTKGAETIAREVAVETKAESFEALVDDVVVGTTPAARGAIPAESAEGPEPIEDTLTRLVAVDGEQIVGVPLEDPTTKTESEALPILDTAAVEDQRPVVSEAEPTEVAIAAPIIDVFEGRDEPPVAAEAEADLDVNNVDEPVEDVPAPAEMLLEEDALKDDVVERAIPTGGEQEASETAEELTPASEEKLTVQLEEPFVKGEARFAAIEDDVAVEDSTQTGANAELGEPAAETKVEDTVAAEEIQDMIPPSEAKAEREEPTGEAELSVGTIVVEEPGPVEEEDNAPAEAAYEQTIAKPTASSVDEDEEQPAVAEAELALPAEDELQREQVKDVVAETAIPASIVENVAIELSTTELKGTPTDEIEIESAAVDDSVLGGELTPTMQDTEASVQAATHIHDGAPAVETAELATEDAAAEGFVPAIQDVTPSEAAVEPEPAGDTVNEPVAMVKDQPEEATVEADPDALAFVVDGQNSVLKDDIAFAEAASEPEPIKTPIEPITDVVEEHKETVVPEAEPNLLAEELTPVVEDGPVLATQAPSEPEPVEDVPVGTLEFEQLATTLEKGPISQEVILPPPEGPSAEAETPVQECEAEPKLVETPAEDTIVTSTVQDVIPQLETAVELEPTKQLVAAEDQPEDAAAEQPEPEPVGVNIAEPIVDVGEGDQRAATIPEADSVVHIDDAVIKSTPPAEDVPLPTAVVPGMVEDDAEIAAPEPEAEDEQRDQAELEGRVGEVLQRLDEQVDMAAGQDNSPLESKSTPAEQSEGCGTGVGTITGLPEIVDSRKLEDPNNVGPNLPEDANGETGAEGQEDLEDSAADLTEATDGPIPQAEVIQADGEVKAEEPEVKAVEGEAAEVVAEDFTKEEGEGPAVVQEVEDAETEGVTAQTEDAGVGVAAEVKGEVVVESVEIEEAARVMKTEAVGMELKGPDVVEEADEPEPVAEEKEVEELKSSEGAVENLEEDVVDASPEPVAVADDDYIPPQGTSQPHDDTPIATEDALLSVEEPETVATPVADETLNDQESETDGAALLYDGEANVEDSLATAQYHPEEPAVVKEVTGEAAVANPEVADVLGEGELKVEEVNQTMASEDGPGTLKVDEAENVESETRRPVEAEHESPKDEAEGTAEEHTEPEVVVEEPEVEVVIEEESEKVVEDEVAKDDAEPLSEAAVKEDEPEVAVVGEGERKVEVVVEDPEPVVEEITEPEAIVKEDAELEAGAITKEKTDSGAVVEKPRAEPAAEAVVETHPEVVVEHGAETGVVKEDAEPEVEALAKDGGVVMEQVVEPEVIVQVPTELEIQGDGEEAPEVALNEDKAAEDEVIVKEEPKAIVDKDVPQPILKQPKSGPVVEEKEEPEVVVEEEEEVTKAEEVVVSGDDDVGQKGGAVVTEGIQEEVQAAETATAVVIAPAEANVEVGGGNDDTEARDEISEPEPAPVEAPIAKDDQSHEVVPSATSTEEKEESPLVFGGTGGGMEAEVIETEPTPIVEGKAELDQLSVPENEEGVVEKEVEDEGAATLKEDGDEVVDQIGDGVSKAADTIEKEADAELVAGEEASTEQEDKAENGEAKGAEIDLSQLEDTPVAEDVPREREDNEEENDEEGTTATAGTIEIGQSQIIVQDAPLIVSEVDPSAGESTLIEKEEEDVVVLENEPEVLVPVEDGDAQVVDEADSIPTVKRDAEQHQDSDEQSAEAEMDVVGKEDPVVYGEVQPEQLSPAAKDEVTAASEEPIKTVEEGEQVAEATLAEETDNGVQAVEVLPEAIKPEDPVATQEPFIKNDGIVTPTSEEHHSGVASSSELAEEVDPTSQGDDVVREEPIVAPIEELSISAHPTSAEDSITTRTHSEEPPQEPTPTIGEQTSIVDETPLMKNMDGAVGQPEPNSEDLPASQPEDIPVHEPSSSPALDDSLVEKITLGATDEPIAAVSMTEDIYIISSTPHIEPLNPGDNDPSNKAVQLAEVPLVEIEITPPADSSKHTLVHIAEAPSVELEEKKAPPTLEHLALVETLTDAQDLPSAIEQVFDAGLTPSPQALLDAVQATLNATLFAPETPAAQVAFPESEEKKEEELEPTAEVAPTTLHGNGHHRTAEDSLAEKADEPVVRVQVEPEAIPVESKESAIVVEDNKATDTQDVVEPTDAPPAESENIPAA